MQRVWLLLGFLAASSASAQNVSFANVVVRRVERDGGESSRAYPVTSHAPIEFNPGVLPWRCMYRLQDMRLPDGTPPPQRRGEDALDTLQVRCWASPEMHAANVVTDIEIVCLPGDTQTEEQHLRSGDIVVSIAATCRGR